MRLFRSRKKRAKSQPGKRRVLFVSHEATLTGAPKIILNILRHFDSTCDIQCETLLHNGGRLIGEFEKHGVVECMDLPRHASDDLSKKVSRFLNRQKGTSPVIAICNSLESRFVADELARHNVPLVTLVHEMPSSYSQQDYANVFDNSSQIVFPIRAVREATEAFTDVPHGKGIVLSQGLLNPDFGTGISHDEARHRLRVETGIPENAFVVLGCGTLDLRKGIDHFVNIARATVMKNSSSTPIHFVWVGEGPRWTHSPYHYVQLDLQHSPARDFVYFAGEREDVEPYFMGADAFMLSSRVDPFPCVIHEAMACGLPVVTFEGSGGSAEAISDGCGFIVPHGDHEHAANVFRMLASQPEIATSMRGKSIERVQNEYRFVDYADRIIDVCESILGFKIRKPGLAIAPQATSPHQQDSVPATIPIHSAPPSRSSGNRRRSAG